MKTWPLFLRRILKRAVPFGLLLFLLFFTSSCTKEKASAIKSGAAQLRNEAATALDEIRQILIQNISMPFDDDLEVASLAKGLSASEFDSTVLASVLEESAASPEETEKIDEHLASIQSHYNQFANMFERLPEGSLLAKKSVAKAERHAVNLTVQMINFASLLKRGDIEVRNNPKRILLIEEVKALQALPNGTSKDDAFKRLARRIVELRKEENDLRDSAVKKCLIAAEVGSTVSELIRTYDSITVNELLGLINKTLNTTAEMTNGNQDVVRLLERYQTLESSFRADPYWNTLLDNPLPKAP